MLGIQQSEAYRKFLFQYSKISVNLNVKNVPEFTSQIWSFYETKKKETGEEGKKLKVENDREILVMMPSSCEGGDSFFNQILHFSETYHIVAIDSFPNFCEQEHFCDSFHKFVKHISKQISGESKKRVHLIGVEYSAFLIQFYSEKYPEYVASLVLVNGYVNSSHFADAFSYLGYYSYFPRFLLRKYISTGITALGKSDIERYKRVAEFLQNKISGFEPEKIISRLKLKCDRNVIRHIENSNVMIVETYDKPALVPSHLLEMMYNFFPNATKGKMKRGMDFPYLTEPDDFNLYLEVFLRRFTHPDEVVVTVSASISEPQNIVAPRRAKRLEEERDSVEEEEIEKYFNVINDKLVQNNQENHGGFEEENLDYVDLNEMKSFDKGDGGDEVIREEYGNTEFDEKDEVYFDELLEYTGL